MKRVLLILFCIPVLASAQITTYNAGQSFTCIAVDSNFNVWAGNATGAYFLNKQAAANAFAQISGTNTYNVNALAADREGNVWAGHNGTGGVTASGGGIERMNINSLARQHYSPDRNAQCYDYLERDGIGSLYSGGLAMDSLGGIWSAQRYNSINTGTDFIITPGTISHKFPGSDKFVSKGTWEDYRNNADPVELPYPAYTCNPGITETGQTRNVYAVAAGKNVVWISVIGYIAKNGTTFPARLIEYNYNGGWTGISFDFATIGIPAGGIFNGLHVTPGGDVWATISAGKGFAVKKGANWVYLSSASLSCILPSGATINPNAIWGNKLGQVFIGTTAGLIVYGGTGPVNDVKSYTLYTTSNNALISNNVLGGASERDSVQWVATNAGIMRTTLGKNSPLSVDSVNYTSCNLADLNAIETALNANVVGREDYHAYKVETKICDQTGTNGKNCNAQFIYKLIKKNVALTAPTPMDFPYDNLSPIFLQQSDKAEIVQMVEQRVNAFDPANGDTSTYGGIKYISQVLSTGAAIANQMFPSNNRIPFLSNKINDRLREDLLAEQKQYNPDTINPCGTYRLYNSSNMIQDRMLYDLTVDNWACGNKLHSPVYDNVWIFPDDKNLTITNYTQPGHFLSPGKVFRYLVEECGQVKMITIGTGLSYCGSGTPGRINAIGNIIVGSILFKNIDLRLKRTFEKTTY